MSILIALLVVAALADAYTTIRFLKDGSDTESNPRGRWFQNRFGVVGGTLLAKGLMAALVIGLAALAGNPIGPIALGIAALMNVYQALDNLDVL